MSREAWRLIRHGKGFYAGTFRRIGSILVLSVSVNLMLGLWIFNVYFNLPDRHIYATNGTMPPEELIPMDEPNYSSAPLLASDYDTDQEMKVVPQ